MLRLLYLRASKQQANNSSTKLTLINCKGGNLKAKGFDEYKKNNQQTIACLKQICCLNKLTINIIHAYQEHMNEPSGYVTSHHSIIINLMHRTFNLLQFTDSNLLMNRPLRMSLIHDDAANKQASSSSKQKQASKPLPRIIVNLLSRVKGFLGR